MHPVWHQTRAEMYPVWHQPQAEMHGSATASGVQACWYGDRVQWWVVLQLSMGTWLKLPTGSCQKLVGLIERALRS